MWIAHRCPEERQRLLFGLCREVRAQLDDVEVFHARRRGAHDLDDDEPYGIVRDAVDGQRWLRRDQDARKTILQGLLRAIA